MDAVKKLVYALLTENTGSHLLDSGGAYGRHWERNAKKSIEDFEADPQAVIELREYSDGDVGATVDISLYHYLTNILHLDDLCNEYNALPVNDWDSDDYYGVSKDGEAWLKEHGLTPIGDTFNSYNGDSNLSQVIQGELLKHDDTGDYYTLLQVHGGCDIRGGYTDAKLFRLDEEYQIYDESCHFKIGEGDDDWLDYRNGEFTYEGNYLDNSALSKIFKKLYKEGVHNVKGCLG